MLLLLLLASSSMAFAQSEVKVNADSLRLKHSISIGLQGPAQSFVSSNSGARMALPSFPLTLRYSFNFSDHHVVGYTGGFKIYTQTPTVALVPNEGAFWIDNRFPIISSRVDYRWFPKSRDHRWQPYVGGGILMQTAVIPVRNRPIVTHSFGLQALAGMRWNIGRNFFVEAEVPLTLALPSFDNLQPQAGPSILRSLGVHQPSRLWPVIGIGYRF